MWFGLVLAYNWPDLGYGPGQILVTTVFRDMEGCVSQGYKPVMGGGHPSPGNGPGCPTPVMFFLLTVAIAR